MWEPPQWRESFRCTSYATWQLLLETADFFLITSRNATLSETWSVGARLSLDLAPAPRTAEDAARSPLDMPLTRLSRQLEQTFGKTIIIQSLTSR